MCFYFFFFKFCPDRKNEQAERKDCYHGSAEASIFHWVIIIGIVPVSGQIFLSTFLREILNTSEKRKCREEGEGRRDGLACSPCFSEGGGQAGFT